MDNNKSLYDYLAEIPKEKKHIIYTSEEGAKLLKEHFSICYKAMGVKIKSPDIKVDYKDNIANIVRLKHFNYDK